MVNWSELTEEERQQRIQEARKKVAAAIEALEKAKLELAEALVPGYREPRKNEKA